MKIPTKSKGDKFEMWLEILLKEHGYEDVERSYRENHGRPYREADLRYTLKKDGRKITVLVEAKYSSNGEIKYKLRSTKKKKDYGIEMVIDNLVDEVIERQKFLGGDESILVTNKTFEDKLKKEAEKKGVFVMEGHELTRMYHELGYTGSIEDSIATMPD
ncbi:restriction endonuclease [Candidatus Woesearchaeota archaeon]|nr:restriction endonuclease [Candidatus Woesearchaeota archaeon]